MFAGFKVITLFVAAGQLFDFSVAKTLESNVDLQDLHDKEVNSNSSPDFPSDVDVSAGFDVESLLGNTVQLSGSSTCDPYAAIGSAFTECKFTNCGAGYITVSTCPAFGGAYSGDTYLYLYKDGVATTGDDDYGGLRCSYISYYQSSSLCFTYTVNQYCWSTTSCSGTTAYTFVSANGDTGSPSFRPSAYPSRLPTSRSPTEEPSFRPPTISPTSRPPTFVPTRSPSREPTFIPTRNPSFSPTVRPTVMPSASPSVFMVTASCAPYSSTSSVYVDCIFTACGVGTVYVTTCPAMGGAFSGDTYLYLYGESGALVASSDDYGSSQCSYIATSRSAEACDVYTVRQRCYSTGSCTGTTVYGVPSTTGSTRAPSTAPSVAPTRDPTVRPTTYSPSSRAPSAAPSPLPSREPSERPTTYSPTTRAPSVSPTPFPSREPTYQVTQSPSASPTTRQPTAGPSLFTITASCAPYSSTSSVYVDCIFTACGVGTVYVTTCPAMGGAFSGDTYLYLYGESGALVASSDDYGSSQCSYIATSRSAEACDVYTVRQRCYSTGSCTGTTVYGVPSTTGSTRAPSTAPSVAPTRDPTVRPTTYSPSTRAPSVSPTTRTPTTTVSPSSRRPSPSPSVSPTRAPTVRPSTRSPSSRAPTATPSTRAPSSTGGGSCAPFAFAAGVSGDTSCSFTVCAAGAITASTCPAQGGSFSGDTYLTLYLDGVYVTYSDDYGGSYCSTLSAQHTSSTCATYTLVQRCFSTSAACSGLTVYTYTSGSSAPSYSPTALSAPSYSPSSLLPSSTACARTSSNTSLSTSNTSSSTCAFYFCGGFDFSASTCASASTGVAQLQLFRDSSLLATAYSADASSCASLSTSVAYRADNDSCASYSLQVQCLQGACTAAALFDMSALALQVQLRLTLTVRDLQTILTTVEFLALQQAFATVLGVSASAVTVHTVAPSRASSALRLLDSADVTATVLADLDSASEAAAIAAAAETALQSAVQQGSFDTALQAAASGLGLSAASTTLFSAAASAVSLSSYSVFSETHAPSASPTVNPPDSGDSWVLGDTLSLGEFVGVCVAGAAVLCVFVSAVYFLCRRPDSPDTQTPNAIPHFPDFPDIEVVCVSGNEAGLRDIPAATTYVVPLVAAAVMNPDSGASALSPADAVAKSMAAAAPSAPPLPGPQEQPYQVLGPQPHPYNIL